MFSFTVHPQRIQSYREVEAKAVLAFSVALLLVAPVGIGGVLAAMGLVGGDAAAFFLLDAPLIALAYIAAITTVSVILHALCYPAETKFATWSFTTCLFNFSPRVVQLLKTLGDQTTTLPALTTPFGDRLAIRPQSSLPSLCFTPGASPQLE